MSVSLPSSPVIRRNSVNQAADEIELIRRAQAGDRDAFGELYLLHRAVVIRFLESQLRHCPADAEDVAADAFITALTKIDRFSLDESGRFANWLIGIARFGACHYRRRRATHPELELLDWSEVHPLEDHVIDAEQVVVDRIEVQAMLARLSAAHRRAIVLQYAADRPVDEVALGMGVSQRAVWKLTERARSSLREQFDPTRKPNPGRVTSDMPAALCACGCGRALPSDRRHNKRFATDACRHLSQTAARKQENEVHAAGMAADDDPALERVLAAIVAAGGAGIVRKELAKRTHVNAARLDGVTEQLVRRRLISVAGEPSSRRRPVTRYRALAGAAAGRAA